MNSTLIAPATIIFQSAKLGNLPWLVEELDWAEKLQNEGVQAHRIFGISGGNLVALAFGLAQAARKNLQTWGQGGTHCQTCAVSSVARKAVTCVP